MLAIAVASCILQSVKLGLGYRTVRIVLEDPTPPKKLANIPMYAYIQTILHAAAILFIKLAIPTLYARVFGLRHHDRFFTHGLYACMVFTVLLGVGAIIEFIAQCVPPPVFWNRIYLLFPSGTPPDGPTEGYCMDQLTHVVVPVALDLVNEVAIMVLPAKILWNLRLPLRKKLGLAVTFGLGIFVCITNIVRITIYAKLVNGGDIAWDDINAFIWTIVQLSVGIICACIPPSAPLLKIWSKKVGTGHRSSIILSDRSDRSNNQGSPWPKSQDKISYRQTFGVSYGDRKGKTESVRDLNGSNVDLELVSRTSPSLERAHIV